MDTIGGIPYPEVHLQEKLQMVDALARDYTRGQVDPQATMEGVPLHAMPPKIWKLYSKVHRQLHEYVDVNNLPWIVYALASVSLLTATNYNMYRILRLRVLRWLEKQPQYRGKSEDELYRIADKRIYDTVGHLVREMTRTIDSILINDKELQQFLAELDVSEEDDPVENRSVAATTIFYEVLLQIIQGFLVMTYRGQLEAEAAEGGEGAVR